MRKVYESIMVIVAAGLAAAIALIDLPIHATGPGTVVGGGDLFAAPPPTSAPALPPLPPLLFPPGSSTPVPIESPATSAPSLPLGAQPRRGMTGASSPAMRGLGTSLAQHEPKPPPASNKPKQPPTSKKPKPLRPTKPEPLPTSNKPKPPKSRIKPKDARKATSAEPSPRSVGSGSAADEAMAAQ